MRLRPAGLLVAAVVSCSQAALADEGGVSFWIPGLFGSLAAAPQQQPGWALASIYYHTTVSAGGDVALQREFTIGRIPAPLNLTASLSANLNATGDLAFFAPSYAFATPVLGGQASLSIMTAVGRTSTSLSGTLSGSLSAAGITIPFTRSDSFGSAVTGFGDLAPQAAIKWNQGVRNYMMYITGDIPVGDYDSTRLSNIGIGHAAFDGGAGYTYFDQKSGHEFSAVGGFTYNFVNPSTHYQNGVDFHLDWAASQFLSKQLLVGGVGYIYDQVTSDRGSAPILGPIQSRVVGAGPQIGYIFPINGMQRYLNFKAYFEFDHHDRADGWNTWVTFAISPPAPPAATPRASRTSMIHK
jgi:hypothetical protein